MAGSPDTRIQSADVVGVAHSLENCSCRTCVILVGKPGMGKGTNAEMFVNQHPESRKIGTGDIFRDLSKPDSKFAEKYPEGREIKEVMAAGDLVRDELVLSIVTQETERMFGEEGAEVVIYDGAIRNREQDLYFRRRILPSLGENTNVLYIDVRGEDDTYRQRVQIRREQALIQGKAIREDDTEEAVEKRLATYYRTTHPLVEDLEASGELHVIDAERPLEEVYADFEQTIFVAMNRSNNPGVEISDKAKYYPSINSTGPVL